MRTSDADILFVPGLGNSGPDHWQTRWEKKLSTGRRVEQKDWDHPRLADWKARIIEEIARAAEASRPAVLIAHSLGSIAVVHAAIALGKVTGAYLITPPSDAAIATLPGVDPAFVPVPMSPLPFPSVLVASRTDPYGSYTDAQAKAEAWGSTLVDAGNAGHINTESGHGPWPEGLMRLATFLKTL
ncbi:MAG: serine hydrolase family protein [Hyphomicrobiales bacterium]|nr:serine hydrolase family protein [Hyphomicrobiales bacterium]MBV8768048.1 serine hydrolase family protein [Hyphomicrobiales bacterium]